MQLPTDLDIIIECTKARLGGQSFDRFDGVSDWPAFLNLTQRHRVVPLLYSSFSDCEWKDVPTDIAQAFRECQKSIVKTSLLLTAELIRISAAFDEAEIPSLSVKGPVLAQQLYGKIEARQFRDIDLLVSAADLPRADSLLKELGYQGPSFDLEKVRPRRRQHVINYFHDIAFMRSLHQTSTLIELHWRLGDQCMLKQSPEASLADTASVVVSGQSLRTLKLTESIAYLAYHGAKHRWMRLIWLVDLIAAIEQMSDAEKDSIVELMHQDSLFKCYLLLGLVVAEKLELSDAFSRFADDANYWRRRLDRMATVSLKVLFSEDPNVGRTAIHEAAWRFSLTRRFYPTLSGLGLALRPEKKHLLESGLTIAVAKRCGNVLSRSLRRLLP